MVQSGMPSAARDGACHVTDLLDRPRIVRWNLRGRKMNRGVGVLVAFLLAAAFLTVPSTAQAESACDPGFALTSGGVPEADLNGDGLTCEVTSVDPGTGLLTIFALDNAPAEPVAGCPPTTESGFLLAPLGKGFPDIDRNGDGWVCAKGESMTSKHPVVIDNNVPFMAGKI